MQFFFLYCSGAHRDLHSFPTRRSSDLAQPSGLTSNGTDLFVADSEVSAIRDRKSTRLNSSHTVSSYAGFCLKKISEGNDTCAARVAANVFPFDVARDRPLRAVEAVIGR